MNDPALVHASKNIANRCLGISSEEQVLIICDPRTRAIAETLRDTSIAAGADTVLSVMQPRAAHGSEPPTSVAAAMLACDVYLAPTTFSLSHTQARKHASAAGVRGATLPGVTEDMLARLMSADLDRLRRRSGTIAQLLSDGHRAEVTCPLGSQMTIDLTGRNAISDDGNLRAPGAFGNLPCGEAFIAPLSGQGQILASSIASVGLSLPPSTLTIADGRLASATGEAGQQLLDALTPYGASAMNLAEFGVGTNDRAMLTGNVLEDEKLLGSIHLAFGASAAIGGTVAVPIHVDVIVTEASLAIDGTPVLDQGTLVLEERRR